MRRAGRLALDEALQRGVDLGERRFINEIRHFARRAADFHRRMDRYRQSPWDVPREIDHLTDDARRVSRQIRSAHAFEHTWDDWDEVVDILVRMQWSAAAEHGRVRYGDHGEGHWHRGGDRASDRVSRRD